MTNPKNTFANKTYKEIKLIRISTIGNLTFGLIGIAFAIITHSRSILFDGLYSFVLSLFTLISAKVVRLVTKGQTVQYQFGYGAYEPLLIIVKSIFLFALYLTLGYEALKYLFTGGYNVSTSYALIYSLFSTIACFFIWLILRKSARKNISPVLKAESYGWFLDTILSGAVLLAFVVINILNKIGAYTIANFIDPFITLCLVILMLPALYKMFLTNFRDLVSAAPPLEMQEELRAIMDTFQNKYDFTNIENFSEKRGRSLYLISHVYLDHDIPMKTLDKIRKEMVKEIKKWWLYSDIDILFTLNPAWIKMSNIDSELDFNPKTEPNKQD